MISFDDFKKLDLRVATVVAAYRVEGSEKLVRLEVDIGDKKGDSSAAPQNDNTASHSERLVRQSLGEGGSEESQGVIRQIIAGIGKNYEPEQLVGRQIIIVANLEPRKLMGLESQGMLLAVDSPSGPVLLCPEKPVPSGFVVK